MVSLTFTKISNGAQGAASGSIDESTITGLQHSVQIGSIDSLTFTVHIPASGQCNWLKPYCTLVVAEDENGELIFRGRVKHLEVSQDDNGTKEVTCEGEQAFLKDSFIFPGSKNPDEEEPEPDPEEEGGDDEEEKYDPYGRIVNGYTKGYHWAKDITGEVNQPSIFNYGYFDIANLKRGTQVTRILEALVRLHNSFTPSEYHLEGYTLIQSSLVLKNDIELAGKTVYEAMDLIAEDTCMEWRAGRIYSGSFRLEMSKRFGTTKGDIKTGANLKSIHKTENMEGVYTAVLPIGGYGYDEKRLSLCSYPCNDSKIYSVRSGNFLGYDDIQVGSRVRPYIMNNKLVSMYGLRIKVVVYDDICVNDASEWAVKRDELLKAAQKEVADMAKDVIQFSADAIDFAASSIGGPGPELSVYDYYNISDYITGINVKLRLTQKDTNYDDIINPSLTFELDDRTNTAEPIAVNGGTTILNAYTGNTKG